MYTSHYLARFALVAGLGLGLTACDSAQDAAPSEPATTDGVFDASVFGTTTNIIAVGNRPDAENADRLFRLNPALSRRATLTKETRFDAAVPFSVKSFQQVAYARGNSDFYGTFDADEGGGRLVRTNRQGQVQAVTDAGIAPKGVFVDISVSNGYVGVADFGTSSANSQVLIYNENFSDGEAPVAVISNLGTGGRVWDLFYAEEEDILFLSKTNGEVAAYDNFIGQVGPVIFNGVPGTTVVPTREFAISNPADTPRTKRSLNLHGISYDSDTDILIVSDVAMATNPLSGRIYTVDDGDTAGSAPNASGTPPNLVDFRARFRSRPAPNNNNTLLGNPVDILGFGGDLYVAAKGTGKVLRFDNILAATGLQGNRAPDAVRDVAGAESVSFFQR